MAGTHALELGHELVSLEQHNGKVTLLFANGVTHTAELVVGADGIHSTVREALFEKSPLRYAGYVAWRGVADGLADSVPRARLTEAWGRGARFGVVPINAHQTYWFATQSVFSGLSCSPEATEAELGQLFGGWAAPIPALIAATPREQILRNDVIDRAPMRGWSRGRVVLLGDGIHSTTPNMGQGAAVALESAWVLADQLDEDSVEASLVAYEQRRTKRTAWVTRQSAWLGRVGQLENGLARWLRDAVSRTTPHSIIYKQLMLSMGYGVTQA